MKKNKGFLSIKQILKVFEREAYNSFHTYSRVLSYSNPEEYKSNVEYLEYYLKSKDNVLLNVYDFNTIEKENFIGLIDKMHYLKNLKKEYYDYPLIEDIISTKKILDDFWYNQPYYDGSYYTGVEEYIVKNYVKNFKKDSRNWKVVRDEYFFEQDYDSIFQIEWEKLATLKDYQEKLKNRQIRESYH